MTTKLDGTKDFSLDLEDGAHIDYISNFLSEEQSIKLMNSLTTSAEVKWTHGIYNMFGKNVKTPRLLWSMRNKNGAVNDKYTVTDSGEWISDVETVKNIIEKKDERIITYAQLNWYKNGNDYIGWHSDKEVANGDKIYSLSLGATRKFVLKHKKTKKKYEIELKNGSLLMMNYEASNKIYKHALPKQLSVNGDRINVTFRNK